MSHGAFKSTFWSLILSPNPDPAQRPELEPVPTFHRVQKRPIKTRMSATAPSDAGSGLILQDLRILQDLLKMKLRSLPVISSGSSSSCSYEFWEQKNKGSEGGTLT